MILTVALPLAASMAYLWWQALQEVRARELALLQAQVTQIERDLQNLWSVAEWLLPRMANRPAFRALSEAACRDEMAVVEEVNNAFLAITLWRRDGRLVCSSFPQPPGQPTPEPHRASLEAGLSTDGLYLSDVFPGQITGLKLVTFTFPVRDAAGEVAGLLSLPMRTKYFEDLLLSLRRPVGGAAGIADRNMVLVVRVPDNAAWQGKSVAQLPGVAAGMRVPEGTFETRGVDGVARVVAQKEVARMGWRVYVGAEEAVLFAVFRQQLLQGVAVFVLVVALSLWLAYRIARGVSRPLRELSSLTDRVARGERSARAAVQGEGELALLAGRVNGMLDELERSEKSLRASEAGYRTLAESSPDAILIHQDLRIVFVNREMVRLMRADSAAQLIGRTSLSLLAPEHVDSARERAQAIYAGEPQARVERTYVRLDGTPIDVEVAAAPLMFDGRPSAQVTVRDVTARKQAERLLRASMARARALAARLLVAEEAERKRIAHDLHDQLGQELTALKIHLETIARTAEPPELRAQILAVAAAGGEALQRVRQMSVDLRPPQLDNLGLVAALRAHVERQAALGKVALHFDSRGFTQSLPADLEIVCFRVVQEALTNVMRHAGAKNAWIELRSTGEGVRITVRDDGPGFDAALVLEQGAASGGLGLPGMQERVGFVGGTLDIRSLPGQGCTVTVTFPVPGTGG